MMCVPPPPESSGRRPPTLRKEQGILLAALGVALVGAVVLVQPYLLPTGPAAPPPSQAPTAAAVATAHPTSEPEQQAQALPSPARLSVETSPAGATVQVDGSERGTTPVVVENLDPGSHLVKLSLPGKDEWQEEISLQPDETKRVLITLEETPEPTATVSTIPQEEAPEPTAPPFTLPEEPFYPIAIMVENIVDARPQSGLARADLVYDALVEGGISRFMAVYLNSRAEAVGPVRSARHYFAHLAAEHNASYVHIGSSPQGYDALRALHVTRLDGTYGDPGFWRDSTRYAPHNAYTSTDLIRSSLDRVRRVAPGSMAGFKFREDSEPIPGPEAAEIELVYPGGYYYKVKYVYSPEERLYRRFMDGHAHKDAGTGEQVSPRNVVVQFVRSWLIPGDDGGRLDMEQLGEGKALFFRDGVVTEGYWQKPSYTSSTEWYDMDGKPLLLNPGRTWVQIVPPNGKVMY